jgi:formate/nitrite transporter FocA (FNT family)
MVWLLPFAETARVGVILIITYLIGLGSFAHIIAGSIEAVYVVLGGAATWGEFIGYFFIPTLVGNTIGGVTLVAAVNYAQVASDRYVQETQNNKGAEPAKL